MSSFKCDRCGTRHQTYNQDNLLLSGIINENEMDEIAQLNENINITDIRYVYYYFEKRSLPIILTNNNAAAIPREYCVDCIKQSIKDTFIEKDPHYGDGVYISIHKNLKNASDPVRYGHGEQVSKREYRIKFKIISSDYLNKISNTGGVVKTKENRWYDKTELIMLNSPDRCVATFKCIEQYKDGEWIVI